MEDSTTYQNVLKEHEMYLKRENIEPMIDRKTKKKIKVFENIFEKMKVYNFAFDYINRLYHSCHK